jgi:hypothetical protein
MKELDNQQIDRVFAGNPRYFGCVSKDELQGLGNRFAVVNMQNHDVGQGTHWVLIYNCRPKEICYFDSEGQVPPVSVANLMSATKKSKKFNPFRIQKVGSPTCGYYCILVAKFLDAGMPYIPTLHQLFTDDADENEKFINSIARKLKSRYSE